MKPRKSLALMLPLLLMVPVASAVAQLPTPISSPILDPGNGHFYLLLNTANWTDSQAEAVALGGNLATVRDSAENAWIFSTFASYGGVDRFLWIGLNDAAVPGQFVWSSGESATYRNWAVDEPDFLNGQEFYVQMFSANAARGPGFPPAGPGTWNEVSDSSYPYEGNPSGNNFGPVFGVVEVVPEPSSVALATLAIGIAFCVTVGVQKKISESEKEAPTARCGG